MRFGISIPPFADFSDPRVLADLARDAENAGWDGFFIWDHIFPATILMRERVRQGPPRL